MKLLICFTHERLYRSFLELGYIEAICNKYPDTEILLSHNANFTNIKSNLNGIKFIELNGFMNKLRKFVLDLHVFKYMDLSVSFKTKIRIQAKIPANKKITLKNFILGGDKRWIVISILGNKFTYKTYIVFLRKLADSNNFVKLLLKKHKSQALLVVSGGPFSNIENILFRYAYKYNVKSALVIDNWDNLSSKSILWHKPKFLGVWGENMSNDAQVIHKFSISSIVSIGNSRIFKPVEGDIKFNFPYVLFAGSGSHFDNEKEIIILASNLLSKYGLKLLYRPHPAYLGNLKIIEDLKVIPNLVIDMQKANLINPYFYTYESLNSLLNHCTEAVFVIAGHSTVIVESLYLGKQVITFSGTRSPYFNNGDLWQGFKHLQELRYNKNIVICNNFVEFTKELELLISKCRGKQIANLNQNFIPEIIPNFDNSYEERLLKFLDNLTN